MPKHLYTFPLCSPLTELSKERQRRKGKTQPPTHTYTPLYIPTHTRVIPVKSHDKAPAYPPRIRGFSKGYKGVRVYTQLVVWSASLEVSKVELCFALRRWRI